MKSFPVILLAVSFAGLAACDRPATETVDFPGDKERIKAAANAAAQTAQAITDWANSITKWESCFFGSREAKTGAAISAAS